MMQNLGEIILVCSVCLIRIYARNRLSNTYFIQKCVNIAESEENVDFGTNDLFRMLKTSVHSKRIRP